MDNPVILFDGVCNLCNGFVNFLIKIDTKKRLRFAPLQSQPARDILDRAQVQAVLPQTVIVVESDTLYRKSDAIIRIAEHLDSPYSLFSILRFIPGSWRDYLYDYIAGNRYAWFGKQDSCRLPDAEYADRFLS